MQTQFHKEVLHKRSPSPSHRNANGYLKIKSPPNHLKYPQPRNPMPQIRSNQIRSHRTTRLLLRLEPQPELSPPPFLTNSVQKPSNTLLLRQPRTIKMLPHHKRERIFAHAVLSDYAAQWLFALASTSTSTTASAARGVRRCGCSMGLVVVVPG